LEAMPLSLKALRNIVQDSEAAMVLRKKAL
jgi:hypothetical protein